MKITIIYDNEVLKAGLKADWGFSCFVEVYGRKILFDTGANGSILVGNMEKLGIDPAVVEEIFISHSHFDHIGGLSYFLKRNKVKVYIPFSCPEPEGASEVVKIKDATEIHNNIFSTGELQNLEQSMVIRTGNKLTVIAGCSHPGVGNIIKAASDFGRPDVLIGGLHGFNEFGLLEDLRMICATHCTQYKEEIKSRYPGKYIDGGAGKIIKI